ncbi:MAG: branched-chain amino acid ABC transporter permease [Dehalococcoidales bacterium]|nr:branched-chain amino acid ABC transporter permease [Dehalococcoidales bacterium]
MNKISFNYSKLLLPGILLAILVVLATLPLYGSNYSIVLLTSIIMYVILTVSWALFSGSTGYISLATAAFFGVGIYTSAILGRTFTASILANEYFVVFIVIIGGLISACLAFIVGAITLRLRGIYFAIFTFGLVELIKNLLLWYEVKFTGTRGRFVVVIGNETIYYVILGILLLLLLVTYFIRRSRYGLALESIGEHEEAAAHIGINVTMVKVIIFAISAVFVGMTGSIMAMRWTYIDPYISFDPNLTFLPVLMAIFGGTRQMYGPIIGAVVFAYLEEILLTRFPYYYMLIFGIVLAATILYLPNGLVGVVQKIIARLAGGKHAHSRG